MVLRCGSRVAAMIPRIPILRRFGTLRAFVVRSYEHLRHERAVEGDVAMECTPERCGIFRRVAGADCVGGFHLHDVCDWRLRICGHASEALRQRLGATHQRGGGVGRDATISSDGQRLDRRHRGVGGERGREWKCDFWDGVGRGSVHGSGRRGNSTPGGIRNLSVGALRLRVQSAPAAQSGEKMRRVLAIATILPFFFSATSGSGALPYTVDSTGRRLPAAESLESLACCAARSPLERGAACAAEPNYSHRRGAEHARANHRDRSGDYGFFRRLVRRHRIYS